MAGYYSKESIDLLEKERLGARQKCDALRERYIVREYGSDKAREYAYHGFCRRLDTMVHCIDYVFASLPPDQESIPEDSDVVAASICLHAFIVNAFGCLDNLAWIWVYETGLKDENGGEIDAKRVGLGASYYFLRKQFTKPFRAYLSSRTKWFRHLTEFRNTLAHRIPLYIPPFIIPDSNEAEYKRLDAAAVSTISQGGDPKVAYQEYKRLRSEQKKLGVFRPWMTHSVREKSPQVQFHFQLLQDFVTVDEFGREMLAELDRMKASPRLHSKPISIVKWLRSRSGQWFWICLAGLAALAVLAMRFTK